MRTQIARLIRWLIAATGRLARRVIGALAAACVAVFLLLLLLLLARDRMPLADAGALVQTVRNIVFVVAGTLGLSLVGFVWPTPFLALLSMLNWLPDVDIPFVDWLDGDGDGD